MPELRGPGQRVGAVHLRDRRPGRVVVEAAALAAPVALEGQVASGRRGHREDLAQRLALGRPGGVAVDPVGDRVAGLLVQRMQRGPVGRREPGVLGDPLGPQVQGVAEAARRGQVRRRLHRRGRLRGVQRVDEHVVGAVLDGGPDAEVGQVGEVTGAPRARGPDAVQLGGQPPDAALAEPLGHADPVRRDDQAHPGVAVAARATGAGVHPVVAQRQVLRDRERRLADELVLDGAGRVPVLVLVDAAPVLAGLELDPHVDGPALGHVHLERRPPALARHQHRRQHPPPGLLVPRGESGPRRVLAARVDAEGGEHAQHRVGARQDVLALPVPVVGGDAVRRRQLAHQVLMVAGVVLRHAGHPRRPRGRRCPGARTSRRA